MAQDFARIFDQTRAIAVVGISEKPWRAGHYVPEYLAQQGFQILGVTPTGHSSLAEQSATTLAGLERPVELVLMFRRSDQVGEHLADILSVEPLPRVVWMQSGIRNEVFARALQARGIEVVSDRCAMVEHRLL
ncbi:MAG: CoA-binding protein [Vulcanimicrobiota bacterium]